MTATKAKTADAKADSRPPTRARRVPHARWVEEAELRFGKSRLDWRFVCPSCGHVAASRDRRDAGAAVGEVAFSCVGRHAGADDANTFRRQGGPCTYAGGGLFRLNPVIVTFEDGTETSVFEFASDKGKSS